MQLSDVVAVLNSVVIVLEAGFMVTSFSLGFIAGLWLL